MSRLTLELRSAAMRGVGPPQDWTTRAVEEIEALERQVESLHSELNLAYDEVDNLYEELEQRDIEL